MVSGQLHQWTARDRRSSKTIVGGAPTFGEGEKGTQGMEKTRQPKER